MTIRRVVTTQQARSKAKVLGVNTVRVLYFDLACSTCSTCLTGLTGLM